MANKHYCSDGKSYTQPTIQSKLSKSYQENDLDAPYYCECCGKRRWEHHDHTISQKACKWLHKTELIWYRGNWSYSCNQCHTEWESFKSGLFANHLNFEVRMLFLKEYDIQNYNLRLQYVS